MHLIETYTENKAGIWKTRKYDAHTPIDCVRYTARECFVWPGGYELCLIMNDGELLCSKCVLENYREILFDTKNQWNTGWRAVGITNESNLEQNICAHCGKSLGY